MQRSPMFQPSPKTATFESEGSEKVLSELPTGPSTPSGSSPAIGFGPGGYMRPTFTESELRQFSLLPGVRNVMGLGSVLAIELVSRPESPQGSRGGSEKGQLPTSGAAYSRRNSAVSDVVALLKADRIHARYTHPPSEVPKSIYFSNT